MKNFFFQSEELGVYEEILNLNGVLRSGTMDLIQRNLGESRLPLLFHSTPPTHSFSILLH